MTPAAGWTPPAHRILFLPMPCLPTELTFSPLEYGLCTSVPTHKPWRLTLQIYKDSQKGHSSKFKDDVVLGST